METTKQYYLEGSKVKLIIHLGESFSCTPKLRRVHSVHQGRLGREDGCIVHAQHGRFMGAQ